MSTIDTILKIAGVKNIEEFYKLYPNEEDFMKVHGKAFEKAQRGTKIKKAAGGITQQKAMEYLKPAQEAPLELEPWMTNSSNFPTEGFAVNPDILGQGLPIVGDIIEGVDMLIQQKKELKRAKQMNKLTDLMLNASQSIAEPIQRKYVRPEDMVVQPDQLFPSYGTGFTPLAKRGRIIPMGEAGIPIPWDKASDFTSNALDRILGETGGSKIGGAVGKGIGTFFGPAGQFVGETAGQLIGGLVDRTDDKIKKERNAITRNVDRMSLGQSMQGLFSLNSGYMQNGGNITNMEGNGELQLERGTASPISYNPYSGETIMFGGPSHDEGGMNIAFGGNPVEVEGGEPGIKMNDADGTENLVVYGNLKIPGYKKTAKNAIKDIAKNEDKIMKKVDKASREISSLNITDKFDKLKHDTLNLNITLADRKLKMYAEEKQDIADMQEAINQTADEMGLVAEDLSRGKIKKARTGAKLTAETGDTKPSYRSLLARILGIEAEPGYDPKTRSVQRWFERNTPASTVEHVPSQIIPINKPAGIMPVNQITPIERPVNQIIPIERPQGEPIVPHDWSNDIYMKYNQVYNSDVPVPPTPVAPTPVAKKSGSSSSTSKKSGSSQATAKSTQVDKTAEYLRAAEEEDMQLEPWMLDNSNFTTRFGITPSETVTSGESSKNKIDWDLALDRLNSFVPYFRESDQERLDSRQILGELMALTDREEPVQTQLFRPNLGEAYNISLQDQVNEIDAQTRAAMRMAGNNPAAQAAIAAEAYRAKSQILGEEFRQNQQLDFTIRQANRELLNQTQLQNLQILDKQYERQAMAKSNTKETMRNALSSIASKYLNNQFENRTLGTYENMYNYRYDNNMRARNRNAPYTGWVMTGDGSWVMAGNHPEDMVPQYEVDPVTKQSKVIRYRTMTEDEKKKKDVVKEPSRNGSVVKALRGL